MMFIICDKSPDKAVDWLVENTSKQFVWKQTLELTQLLATCGITDQMKPLRQGKQICEWIKKKQNIYYVFLYYLNLLHWCDNNVKMLPNTYWKLYKTCNNLRFQATMSMHENKMPKTAIWRYSKEYESDYPTNSELPIEVVCELYKEYIKWKFSV